MDSDLSVLCRACGQKNLSFCDLNHETVKKLHVLVPKLFNFDENLPKMICITCYQMMKTLVFNLEGILDTEKILKIQISAQSTPATSPVKTGVKRSYVEDISKKLTHIKVRKVVVEKLPELTVIQPTRDYKVKALHQSLSKSPAPSPQASTAKNPDKVSITRTVKLDTSKIDLKSTTGSAKKHICFCGETLSSPQELNKHMTDCHDQKTDRLICKPCKKVFQTPLLLRQHQQICNNLPAPMHFCMKCKTKLKTPEELKAHSNTCKRKSNEA